MAPDRVFLDANVLFSAAYGSPGLRQLWALQTGGADSASRCRLLTSAQTAEEARRNLDRPAQLRRLERYLRQIEIVTQPPPREIPLELPPEDALILAAALAARATHFLTGDLRHFGAYYGRRVEGALLQRPGEYLRG